MPNDPFRDLLLRPQAAAPRWVGNPFAEDGARPIEQVHIEEMRPFGRPKKMKFSEAGPADEKFFQTLLESVEDILEKKGFIDGPACLELLLKVKKMTTPISIHVEMPNLIENSIDDYLKLQKSFSELGWGRGTEKVRPPGANYWRWFQFNVKGYTVNLCFEEKHKEMDELGINLSMMRYDLDNGLVVDPRAQKDLDNCTVTCDKKVSKDRMEKVKSSLLPALKEMTGKEFTIKKGK